MRAERGGIAAGAAGDGGRGGGAAPPARQPPPEVPGRAQAARRVAAGREHPGARERGGNRRNIGGAAAEAGWVEPPACPRAAATPERARAAPPRLAEHGQGRRPGTTSGTAGVAGNAGSVGADSAGCSCDTVLRSGSQLAERPVADAGARLSTPVPRVVASDCQPRRARNWATIWSAMIRASPGRFRESSTDVIPFTQAGRRTHPTWAVRNQGPGTPQHLT